MTPTNKQQTQLDEIPGANILLIGPVKTGKTTALKTLLDVPGLEVFYIPTEPRYDVLGKAVLDRFHWRYIPPATVAWEALLKNADIVNKLSNEALQKMQGVQQSEYRQFMEVINQCNDFVDQHGKHWGDVSQWGTDRILVFDGLTGISKMARYQTVGTKPVLSQPDWGVAMQLIETFVSAITTSKRCHLCLIAHVEKEIDELRGGTRAMVSTLGRKLAPLIPVNFSDVILSVKEGMNFYWDTADLNTDVGSSNIPLKSKQEASFVPLFAGWMQKGGIFTPTPTTVNP